MSKPELYFQCGLSNGTGRDVAYIEEAGAKVGSSVEIKQGSGEFWTVDSVGIPGITKEKLRGLQDDHHKGFASID